VLIENVVSVIICTKNVAGIDVLRIVHLPFTRLKAFVRFLVHPAYSEPSRPINWFSTYWVNGLGHRKVKCLRKLSRGYIYKIKYKRCQFFSRKSRKTW